MAEQKNQNEHLNVEDALTQSEAFLIKYKNAIIGGVVAVIIIVAGFIMYKNLYAEPREEKAQAALFKGQEYFEQDAYEQALNGDSIGCVGFLKVADEYSGTKASEFLVPPPANIGQGKTEHRKRVSFANHAIRASPFLLR